MRIEATAASAACWDLLLLGNATSAAREAQEVYNNAGGLDCGVCNGRVNAGIVKACAHVNPRHCSLCRRWRFIKHSPATWLCTSTRKDRGYMVMQKRELHTKGKCIHPAGKQHHESKLDHEWRHLRPRAGRRYKPAEPFV